jgi:hypothetical protein
MSKVPRSRYTGKRVVRQSVCHLGETVGRQGQEHQHVGPIAQFNVQDGITEFIPVLPFFVGVFGNDG